MVKNDRRCWFYHEFLRDCVVHRKVGRGIVRGIAALGILGITRSGETGLVILNITERLTLTRVWETNINKHAYMNLHYNKKLQQCEVPEGSSSLSLTLTSGSLRRLLIFIRGVLTESLPLLQRLIWCWCPPLHLKFRRSKNLHSFKNTTAQHKNQTKDT